MQTVDNKEKMIIRLPERKWSSAESLALFHKLNSQTKNDLCTIFIDGLEHEPSVYEVFEDVFKNIKQEKIKPCNVSYRVSGFKVELIPQEDGGFTIRCPLLRGCISQGETAEEAILNITEAIDGYLECMKNCGIQKKLE